MAEDSLSEDAKDAIRTEVSRLLRGLAALFGIANIAVLAAIAYGAVTASQETAKSVATSEATEVATTLAKSVASEIFQDQIQTQAEILAINEGIELTTKSMNAAVGKAGEITYRISKLQQNLSEIDPRLETLSADVSSQEAKISKLKAGDQEQSIDVDPAILPNRIDEFLSRLKNLETEIEDVWGELVSTQDTTMELVSRRKELKFRAVFKPYSCNSEQNNQKIQCEPGEYNSGAVLFNSYPGGACGEGSVINICISERF